MKTLKSIKRMPRIIFSENAFFKDNLYQEIAHYGECCLVLCGEKSVRHSGRLAFLLKKLSDNRIKYFLIDGIKSNPTCSVIDSIIKRTASLKFDFLIAFGGSSVTDVAKAVAVSHFDNSTNDTIWSYCTANPKKLILNALPIVAIPTVPGYGAEYDACAVIVNNHLNKISTLYSEKAMPKLVIVDPNFLKSLPREILIQCIMDIFVNLTETYFSNPRKESFDDAFSITSITILFKCIEKIQKVKYSKKSADYIFGLTILVKSGLLNLFREGPRPLHLLAHVLTAEFNINHGRSLAICLIPYLNCIVKSRKSKIIKLLRVVFPSHKRSIQNNKSANVLLEKLNRWLISLGMELKINLKDLRNKRQLAKYLTRKCFSQIKNKQIDLGIGCLNKRNVENIYQHIINRR